jgi:hypothetical protein
MESTKLPWQVRRKCGLLVRVCLLMASGWLFNNEVGNRIMQCWRIIKLTIPER